MLQNIYISFFLRLQMQEILSRNRIYKVNEDHEAFYYNIYHITKNIYYRKFPIFTPNNSKCTTITTTKYITAIDFGV